jgi:hypothetical protein
MTKLDKFDRALLKKDAEIEKLWAERQRLREALRKTLTCGLDSSVREIVVAALRGASPELS